MTKHNLPVKERFMKYILFPENFSDCWIWIGSKVRNYGCFGIGNKIYLSHRVSFELFVGPIPEGLYVCHSCDNPVCVNPSHLFLGTQKDNMADRNNKNRQAHNIGEKNGFHKLTEQEVYKTKEMIEQGYTQREIAELFGVSQVAISLIKRHKNWGWLK